ncbi:VOC family protein [Lederbergia sp. NSJ-179]|uniref:VOC family protein n=1 Tax=Lederbergia sp. NSJ-179 TaxID=2931402 RepID=UPI001FD603B5|nr:VOC family protein [Lederbergia sp. NSJ-179]MCJ7841909.1 VOC family protein [Lederbergia sp. NSJ-179]
MRWHHAGIDVRNLDHSISFYESMFDFKMEQFLTLSGEKIAFLKNEDVKIELIELEDIPPPCHSVHIAWQVEDIESWMKRLRGKGLSSSEGPYKLKNGWVTVFYEGLDGEVIELIQVCNRKHSKCSCARY